DAFSGVLAGAGVVVFPGFVALDRRGRAVTLGRGGSDLTALFLAHALGAARCRLVKDVDGLYNADPRTVPGARRLERVGYDGALATDGSIVQHKAVRFAEARGVAFELGDLGARSPTMIGMCLDNPGAVTAGIDGSVCRSRA
ncbi:MAG: homoserine dehydrogenase, partial [Planctomycetota bacterium]